MKYTFIGLSLQEDGVVGYGYFLYLPYSQRKFAK